MAGQEERIRRGTQFPIVEIFGHAHDADSDRARAAFRGEVCPFAGGICEKNRQYGFGYCSVTYAAQWDGGRPHPYAVCDHRLDGAPVDWALTDHFGGLEARLVPEVTVTTNPKLNIDYMAYRDDPVAEEGVDLIAIETQAIDLRGGGVGPAFEAWKRKDTENWRAYFTEEAIRKNRRDTVDYGVNVGNVYKRLGTQVAIKGEFLRQVHVPLYVITQNRIFEQLRKRVNFRAVTDDQDWDITFAGFEYSKGPDVDGVYSFGLSQVVRTTLDLYVEALTGNQGSTKYLRAEVIEKVKKKDRP